MHVCMRVGVLHCVCARVMCVGTPTCRTHRNCVCLYSVWDEPKKTYLVLELLTGMYVVCTSYIRSMYVCR